VSAITPASLFEAHFLPAYPPDAREDLARARAADANPAKNKNIYAHLADAAAVFVANAPRLFEGETLDLDYSDASVHRLSAALTRARREAWLSDGADGADGTLFNVVIHGAAYVGECVVRAHGGAWAVRRPLWESLVSLTSRAGEAQLAVFHWWLKSLSDEALDGGASLADRYRAHVEVPCATPEDLPVIAAPDRRLPKLAKPSYSALYKHMRAHLPELRDVGEHFPSAERFDELGLTSVSFLLVGGGRALVMWAPSKAGLHVMWLTAAGFDKAAFYAADAFPEPLVREGQDGKLEIALSLDGATRSFEVLWWGP
jgi:hypothetical protein